MAGVSFCSHLRRRISLQGWVSIPDPGFIGRHLNSLIGSLGPAGMDEADWEALTTLLSPSTR